jgi:hypothetical protein
MRNMCEYPFILDGDPRNNLSEANITDYNSDGMSRLNQFSLPRIGASAGGPRNVNKSFSTVGGVNESMLAGRGGKPVIR